MEFPVSIPINDLHMGLSLMLAGAAKGKYLPADIMAEMRFAPHAKLYAKVQDLADSLSMDLVMSELTCEEIMACDLPRFVMSDLGDGRWFIGTWVDNQMIAPKILADEEMMAKYTVISAIRRQHHTVQ